MAGTGGKGAVKGDGMRLCNTNAKTVQEGGGGPDTRTHAHTPFPALVPPSTLEPLQRSP